MNLLGWLGLAVSFLGINLQGIIRCIILLINKYIKWWASVINFSNDEFARHTIKYRFKSILCDLNEQIEAVKLTCESQKKWLFDYDAFCKGTDFNTPHALFGDLYKQYPESFLKDLLDKYSGDKSFSSNREFLEKAPFIDVEHFFYFYIYVKLFKEQNEEVKVFLSDVEESNEDVSCFIDPYKRIKRKSIEDDIKNKQESLIIAGLDVVSRIANNEYTLDENPNDLLEKIIIYSLNSNSYDLSQLHTTGRYKAKTDNYDICGAKGMIDFLGGSKKQRTVHYLVDNSGVELFLDLVLGYALLNMLHLRINRIVYHVNVLPVFVSDVIEDDIDYTLRQIERCIIDNQVGSKYIDALGKIKEMLEKRAIIEPDFIWNMPTPYEDISKYNMDLYNRVFENRDNLLIVKGDLNYRRLCRDKAWKNTNIWSRIRKKSRLDFLTRYIQTPTLVIRCFKSNVILDVEEDRVMKRDREDWDWRTNGKYGVIKFMPKEERRQTLLSRIIKRH